VIQRPQAGTDDDGQGGLQAQGEVGEIPLLVDRHQESSGALHQGEVAGLGHGLALPCQGLEVEGPPGAPRCCGTWALR